MSRVVILGAGVSGHTAAAFARKWLDRRSQRARMSWERFKQLLRRYPLLPPRVIHSVYRPTAKPRS